MRGAEQWSFGYVKIEKPIGYVEMTSRQLDKSSF